MFILSALEQRWGSANIASKLWDRKSRNWGSIPDENAVSVFHNSQSSSVAQLLLTDLFPGHDAIAEVNNGWNSTYTLPKRLHPCFVFTGRALGDLHYHDNGNIYILGRTDSLYISLSHKLCLNNVSNRILIRIIKRRQMCLYCATANRVILSSDPQVEFQ